MNITVHKAKTNLSKILLQVEEGEEVVVCRGKLPVAKIVPYKDGHRERPPVGQRTSKPFKIPERVFDPLSQEELKEWGI
jgi:prevent-host-death family protein